MSAKVLGRITSTQDRPRGPDALMSVSVPAEWIALGATLEIELPRNLTCAGCDGGGCDACERSGAVSLRGRHEPVELVELTLPAPSAADEAPSPRSRGLVLRIPDRGGLPKEGTLLPRGNLLLSVREAAEPARGVIRLAAPSIPPPPPVEIVPDRAAGAPAPRIVPSRRITLLVAALVVLVAALAAWILR